MKLENKPDREAFLRKAEKDFRNSQRKYSDASLINKLLHAHYPEERAAQLFETVLSHERDLYGVGLLISFQKPYQYEKQGPTVEDLQTLVQAFPPLPLVLGKGSYSTILSREYLDSIYAELEDPHTGTDREGKLKRFISDHAVTETPISSFWVKLTGCTTAQWEVSWLTRFEGRTAELRVELPYRSELRHIGQYDTLWHTYAGGSIRRVKSCAFNAGHKSFTLYDASSTPVADRGNITRYASGSNEYQNDFRIVYIDSSDYPTDAGDLSRNVIRLQGESK